MYQSCYGKNNFPLGLTKDSSSASREDPPFPGCDDVALEEARTYRFLSDTIVWLDIIASITLGRSPHLLPYHAHIIGSDAQTKLEEIMGCKNWVMLQISRIAALQEIKTQAMRQDHFDCSELRQSVADIGKHIKDGLALLTSQLPDISRGNSPSNLTSTLDPSRLVTHVFAYMASIYLHLVIEGFQNLEILSTTISEAMRMLQSLIPSQTLSALVAPLYIIGSVARQGEKQFFQHTFSSPPVLDLSLTHRGRILPVLEEIWSKRQSASFFAWEDSLELTQDILLI